MTLYERMRQTCIDHDTTLTAVLNKIGRSDGSTGSWKQGKSPRLDIVMEIADCLNVTLDELVYGEGRAARVERGRLTDEQREWLAILDGIPDDRRELCKDFLRTHMVEPEKYKTKIEA